MHLIRCRDGILQVFDDVVCKERAGEPATDMRIRRFGADNGCSYEAARKTNSRQPTVSIFSRPSSAVVGSSPTPGSESVEVLQIRRDGKVPGSHR